MSFSGKYELQSRENFVPFMKAVETPDELIQKFKDVKSITEIVQNGNHFNVTITTGESVIHNVFTIGQEAEFGTLAGYKIKGVPNLDGPNKIIVKLNSVSLVTELNGDKLIDTLTVGDITYTRISKRI
ncbi:fatty acid-binding protein 1, liver-like [Pristis pectinata]|uniref:fatty acid-binding protein 1, liver-like n=1 Tax=Pristis pectinata TaxID=685728 RepID=UPI00223D8F59|nr:fatty acid-binding protein 1, liver-like [Pristis pectinata]